MTDDPRVATLVTAYGKRTLAEWLVQEQTERERFEKALREIARWDKFKTLGYEGPKRVACDALDGTESPAAPPRQRLASETNESQEDR